MPAPVNLLGSGCLSLLLILTVATGCASRTGYVIGVPLDGPRRRAADIVVVDHGNPRDYHIVGRVHAHTQAPTWLPCLQRSQDELLEALKREAALLRADVILDLKRYSRGQFEWHEEHLMGTAAIIVNKKAADAP